MIASSRYTHGYICARCAWLFYLALAISCWGQSPTRSGAANRIAGRAVSALDGRPLAGVTVAISNPQTGQVAASVTSGEDGGFAFQNVPPGKYRLEGVRTGYLPSAYQQHEQFFTGIVTGTVIDTESLALELAPAATISGHITDEAGDPVRNATVTLYSENRETGKTAVTRGPSIQADDLGGYEIPAIPPGTYFLSVRAMPWYAVHPARDTSAAGALSASAFDPALDVAYPLTFYANATTSEEALPIPVRGGDQLTIDMQLASQPAVRLTVTNLPGEQGPRIPQLELPVFDTFEQISGDVQSSQSRTEMVGIAPGRYRLSETDPRTGGRTTSLYVDRTRSADAGAASTVIENGALTIHLKDASGAKLPTQMVVTLRNTESGASLAQPINEEGEVRFAGLEPGDYQVSAASISGPYHAVRGISDGRRLRDTLHVAQGTTTSVAVEIAPSSGAVDGIVKHADQPAGGVMVVLVPLDRTSDAERFRRDQSDLDGSFTLPNIVPGRYAVIAIEDGWKLEWGRREVLTRYLARGVPVTITEEDKQPVRLTTAVQMQPR